MSAPFVANNGFPADSKVYKLEKESELRCEVPWDGHLTVKLLEGMAEIFGTEIAQGQELHYKSGSKFAVFTWYGASVEISGQPEVSYVADETPMVSYVNTHAVLEARRQSAREASSVDDGAAGEESQGPRTIIVGPTDSGKSTLCKILLSYAARLGWQPTLVDLDIGQGQISIPGSTAATLVDKPVDPVEGYEMDSPLVYFYGHVSPSENPDLYRTQVEQLARMLERRFAGSAEFRNAGAFINTMGWVESLGYDLLLHAIDAFRADVILVLGQERLFSQLTSQFHGRACADGNRVDVVKLNKSGGVVNRNPKHRLSSRTARVREYFYGAAGDLSPHAMTVAFSDVQIYRIGGGPKAPSSALPVGAQSHADPIKVTHVSISKDLTHAVLGVSYAASAEQLLSSNVAGFIYVTEVDTMKRTLTYVAPSPGPLPSTLLLAGSLMWIEQ